MPSNLESQQLMARLPNQTRFHATENLEVRVPLTPFGPILPGTWSTGHEPPTTSRHSIVDRQMGSNIVLNLFSMERYQINPFFNCRLL